MAGAFWAESRLAVLLLCGGAANGLGGCSRVPGMLVLLATARFRAKSDARALPLGPIFKRPVRSEEHTSELQSLMRISSAVFCLKKKKHRTTITIKTHIE